MVRALTVSGRNDGTAIPSPNPNLMVGSAPFCPERLSGENMAEWLGDPDATFRPPSGRVSFKTPRNFDFFSEEALTKQIGHGRKEWSIALLKELIDNGLDACEMKGTPPVIEVTIDKDGFSVRDNGPGLPRHTLAGSLDYDLRISDKTYYVSPTRGQQGNALKCVWAAPAVMDEANGFVEVSAHGKGTDYRQRIQFSLDHIARKAVRLDYPVQRSSIKNGTLVRIQASYAKDGGEARFLCRSQAIAARLCRFQPAWSF